MKLYNTTTLEVHDLTIIHNQMSIECDVLSNMGIVNTGTGIFKVTEYDPENQTQNELNAHSNDCTLYGNNEACEWWLTYTEGYQHRIDLKDEAYEWLKNFDDERLIQIANVTGLEYDGSIAGMLEGLEPENVDYEDEYAEFMINYEKLCNVLNLQDQGWL